MRHTIDVQIDEEGRDKGKLFRITEMPAWRGEEWGMKVLLALTKAGADIPDPKLGIAGVKIAGLQAMAGLNFAELKPLLDEMFECIVRVPDPKVLTRTRPLQDDDTEEVTTRLRLRAEVFNLHTDFLKAGLFSKQTSETSRPASSDTQTSVQPSEQFSQRAMRA